MATLYRKTPTGTAEIHARAHRLTPRMRGALILVDGHRSEGELLQLIPGNGADALGGLVSLGLIEPFAGGASPPEPARRFVPYEVLRDEAARRLLGTVGPGADSLAQRIAQAPDLDALRALLLLARRLIGELRGAQAAEDYIEGLSAM